MRFRCERTVVISDIHFVSIVFVYCTVFIVISLCCK